MEIKPTTRPPRAGVPLPQAHLCLSLRPGYQINLGRGARSPRSLVCFAAFVVVGGEGFVAARSGEVW